MILFGIFFLVIGVFLLYVRYVRVFFGNCTTGEIIGKAESYGQRGIQAQPYRIRYA